MVGLETLITILGADIVRAAFDIWTGRKQRPRGTIGELVDEQVPGALDRRRLLRALEQVEDSVIERLSREYSGVEIDEQERQRAVEAVAESFEAAHLTPRDLQDSQMDPTAVEQRVRDRSQHVRRSLHLSTAGTRFYDDLLGESSAIFATLVSALPEWQGQALGHLLRRNAELEQSLQEALDRLPPRHQPNGVEQAERAYRAYLAGLVGRVEIAGFDLPVSARSQTISAAFIKPAVKFRNTVVPLDWALADNRLIFLHGPPGSGKTSILQWLATVSAQQRADGLLSYMNNLLPLYIRLRQVSSEVSWPPERSSLARFASLPATAQEIESIIEQRANDGSLLVLIDGLDEVAQERRQHSLEWIQEAFRKYPKCHYVLTSRSVGIAEYLHAQPELAIGEVQALDWWATKQLIRQWFAALEAGLREESTGEPVAVLSRRLMQSIEENSRLRELTATPLLCTLTCAVYWARRGSLPMRGSELYRSFVDMFVERRDVERAIAGSALLAREEALVLLGALARYMVVSGAHEVSAADALKVVAREMQRLPKVALDERRAYSYLVERTGLVAELSPGMMQFVHRTFMEYLCAKTLIDQDDIGLLVERAHESTWQDVIAMAVGLSRADQADRVLRRLMVRYESEPLRRPVLGSIMQTCLNNAPALRPATRRKVEELWHVLPPIATAVPHIVIRAEDQRLLRDLQRWLQLETPVRFSRAVVIESGPRSEIVISSQTALPLAEIVQAVISWQHAHPWSEGSEIAVSSDEGSMIAIRSGPSQAVAPD
ncbi:NACHT domain-containing protein [Micromonospora chersina]|uniref:NACHT domain-containing protein n=1 Tax=Micromonospora chersina TaxID=47854 RepID=UPI003722BC52